MFPHAFTQYAPGHQFVVRPVCWLRAQRPLLGPGHRSVGGGKGARWPEGAGAGRVGGGVGSAFAMSFVVMATNSLGRMLAYGLFSASGSRNSSRPR